MHFDRLSLQSLKSDRYILLDEYVMDVKGFYPFVNELVRDIFVFKRNYIERAKVIFESMNPQIHHTMVSIHIRLTDMDLHLQKNWHLKNDPDLYLEKAMVYFCDRYDVRIYFGRK